MGVFDSISINGMTLRNRFARSATWEGLADPDGQANARLESVLAELAAGEVGLVISSHAYVEKRGQAGPWQLGAHQAAMGAGIARLARAVHAKGGRFVVQLAHAGCRANPDLTGEPALGPSVPDDPKAPPCREMTPDDLARMEAAFGAAAALCREAGADGVELHAAHGYGLSQFLSPRTNRRAGAYGGCLENRARLLLEVLAAIRGRVGRDYPVLAKLNSEDFMEGGLTRAESLQVAKWLEAGGLDAIEVSGGTFDAGPLSPVRPGRLVSPDAEAWYREAARDLKAALAIPVILVGGIRSLDTAEALLDEGAADLVALSRPLIREPRLVARWRAGDRTPSDCAGDNACFVPAIKGEGLRCLTREREEKRRQRLADASGRDAGAGNGP